MCRPTWLIASILALSIATVATAATTEIECRAGRARAIAKYDACIGQGFARSYGGSPKTDLFTTCVRRLANAWINLQALTGTTCDAPRWEDNGDGTVTDNLTGLVWQKTDDNGGLTDKDNVYLWTDATDGDLTDEDGTVYSDFLTNLNAGSGFAGVRGWRLPTFAELATIFSVDPWPCVSSPCIDQTVFGPANLTFYWSSTTHWDTPTLAFVMFFHDFVAANAIDKDDDAYPARAVRGGS